MDKINFHVYLVLLENGKQLKVNVRKLRKLVKEKPVIHRPLQKFAVVEDNDEEEDLDYYEDKTNEEGEETRSEEQQCGNQVNEQDRSSVVHPHNLTDKQVKESIRAREGRTGTAADNRANMEAQYFMKKADQRRRR